LKSFPILLFLAFLFSIVTVNTDAQTTTVEETYYRVQIDLQDKKIWQLIHVGVELCHVGYTPDGKMVAEITGKEVSSLEKHGFKFEILIEDMTGFYQQRYVESARDLDLTQLMRSTPTNFSLGSMAGQKTLDEVMEDLDKMHELYPDLISERIAIGTSLEGREIYAVWIGKEMDQDKPQVQYNSLIHAREPQAMMTVIYYMWWLLENYGSDELATFIVDQRHSAFIPVLNPDGYEYNRSIAPQGGGLHRKNRRAVGTNNQGVDLNRNFGPMEFWDHPNGGSSLFPNGATFRGDGPFSEPETQVLRRFTEDHDFRTAFNYHSYSNLLVMPYGALQSITPDSTLFRSYAAEMTFSNGYLYGTDIETVGYNTRGNADDWMYGKPDTVFTERSQIISMTPEVGNFQDGFWPDPERIIDLCAENLEANKLLALYAGPELRHDHAQAPLESAEVLMRNEINALYFQFPGLYNYGRTATDGMELELLCEDEHVLIQNNKIGMPAIQPNETFEGLSDAFLIELDNSNPEARWVDFQLKLQAPWMRQAPVWSYSIWVEEGSTTGFSKGVKDSNFYFKAHPNPFSTILYLEFETALHDAIQIELKDVEGKVVFSQRDFNTLPGINQINIPTEALKSGIYICSIYQSGGLLSKKIVKLP